MSSDSGTKYVKYVLYHYEPSLAAAASFCALFLISTILHFYQTIRTRAWYTIPLLLGCLCEVIGYIGRILSANQAPDYALGPYIIQSILLLIAPPLIAATIYMIMGYVILATDGESHSLIRKKFLTKIFVIGDIISFMVQSAGAGLLSKGEEDSKKAGNWIVIGGLAIQIIFFGFFMVVTLNFWSRMQARPTAQSQTTQVRWRLQLLVLFLASFLIMVRSIFRVVEYVQGNDGYLFRHEVYLYVFDSVPMLVSVVLFNIVHPTHITALVKGGNKMVRVVLAQPVEKLDQCEKTGSMSSVRDEEIAISAPAVVANSR